MNVWWRKEPLSEQEEFLVSTLFEAHWKSTFRDNASSMAVANAAAASQDMGKAIAAGLMTIGGKHAPLEQTYEFLRFENPADWIDQFFKLECKIPGWGGTFQKDQPDPIWSDVDNLLRPSVMADRIDGVTEELHNRGKKIYPNPSAYTAATAIVIGLSAKQAVYLFIASRLDGWAKIASKYLGD